MSGMLAVFAFAFFAAVADAAAGEAAAATGELCAAVEDAEDAVAGDPDDATGDAEEAIGDTAAPGDVVATGAGVAALPDAEPDEVAGSEPLDGGADADPLQAVSSRTPAVTATAIRGRRPCRTKDVRGDCMGILLQSSQVSEHLPRRSTVLARGQ
jgi:hypothetical protein